MEVGHVFFQPGNVHENVVIHIQHAGQALWSIIHNALKNFGCAGNTEV